MNGFVVAPSPGRIALLGACLFSTVAAALWARDASPPPTARAPAPAAYRYVLHAPSNDYSVYFSAWNEGATVGSHAPADGRALTYRRNFVWSDGCLWQSVERLTPSGDIYLYNYDEHLESCPAGRHASGVPSPRAGFITVEPLAQPTPTAPPVAFAASGKSGLELDGRFDGQLPESHLAY